MDWSNCPDVERVPGKLSGAWIVKDTRIPVQGLIDNAEDFTPEQIVADIYPSVPLDRARRIIAFVLETHAPRPA